jgi:chromosome segregation ATPase
MDQAIDLPISEAQRQGLLTCFFPKDPTGKLLFCFFTPFFLFTALFCLIAINPYPWGMFPFASLILSFSLTLLYRKWGFAIGGGILLSSLIFLSSVAPLGLWTVGFWSSQVGALAILFLCLEEVQVVFEEIQQEVKARVKEYHCLAEAHQSEIRERDQLEKTLKDEIVEWKQEAEQRALDYRGLLEKVEIYDADVSLMQTQKDELMERAFSGEKIVKEHQESLESVKQKESELKEQLARIDADKELYQLEIAELKKTVKELHEAKEQLARVTADKEHYSSQIAEFEKTVKELHETKEQLARVTANKEECSSEIAELKQNLEQLHQAKKQLACVSADKEHCHSEIAELKQSIEKLNNLKEALQQKAQKKASPILAKMISGLLAGTGAISIASPDDTIRRECAKWEGMYRQLRQQFDEKNQTLHLARQELFKLQGELQAKEIEFDQERLEGSLEEYKEMEALCKKLEEELEESRHTISELEALVSHVLHG